MQHQPQLNLKADSLNCPKTDAEIAKCINDKFKTSTTVKNGNATVSGGVATLTGEVSSGGAKGGQTNVQSVSQIRHEQHHRSGQA
ncbi:MAG: hypothetical protein U0Y68_01160 [Blastocatellia bacterium]